MKGAVLLSENADFFGLFAKEVKSLLFADAIVHRDLIRITTSERSWTLWAPDSLEDSIEAARSTSFSNDIQPSEILSQFPFGFLIDCRNEDVFRLVISSMGNLDLPSFVVVDNTGAVSLPSKIYERDLQL